VNFGGWQAFLFYLLRVQRYVLLRCITMYFYFAIYRRLPININCCSWCR